MFKKMDTSGDNKLSKKEFIEAIPNLKKWGVLVTDVNAEFDNIDTNKGGEILFDEFSHYCI
jgi:Ca2+-binding EF-hand superfamily protein